MKSEAMAQFINFTYAVLEYYFPGKWFVSFGTMLYFLRGDKLMGRPFEGDFDVSVLDAEIDADVLALSMEEYNFELKRKIVHSVTKKPLQMVFGSNKKELKGMELDVFFWIKGGNYYWHTYDYYMEFPANSIPREYIFKATPAEAMKGEPWKYSWEVIAPSLNFPRQYGRLMDIWYPGWFVPDAKFGQSCCVKEVKVKNCKKLEEKLV